ncbi:acylphosphatase [Acidiferrobacter thiooxydans]|jgi:acylphosphatase|nr:acylphosphatase [Acidiferrobacter thiooxydans]MDA8192256.1 acylphosphatase [Gammaproteobacteria bacterium]UEN99187.1 acylphosphatase [Acidiferrobacter thiooxydans]
MGCVRLTVTGTVQGVGFRAYVRDEARHLGVTGWVRNRANGSVEVLACGPETALAALTARIAKGPAGAQVMGVGREAADEGRIPESFLVRYDEI